MPGLPSNQQHQQHTLKAKLTSDNDNNNGFRFIFLALLRVRLIPKGLLPAIVVAVVPKYKTNKLITNQQE